MIIFHHKADDSIPPTRTLNRPITALAESMQTVAEGSVGLRRGRIPIGILVRRVRYHRRTRVPRHMKQPLTLKHRQPHLFQAGKGLCN